MVTSIETYKFLGLPLPPPLRRPRFVRHRLPPGPRVDREWPYRIVRISAMAVFIVAIRICGLDKAMNFGC
jgi:hypothetical protein